MTIPHLKREIQNYQKAVQTHHDNKMSKSCDMEYKRLQKYITDILWNGGIVDIGVVLLLSSGHDFDL